MMDPVATKNLVTQVRKMPILIRDAFYRNEFYMFVTGIRKLKKRRSQRNSVQLRRKKFPEGSIK